MRALQKLVRNGSSTQVTIARPMLIALGWIPGDAVIVEMTIDGRLVISKHDVSRRTDVRVGNSVMLPDSPTPR